MANEIVGKANYSVRSIPSLQYQWWWTQDDEDLHPGIGVGLHLTTMPQDEFVADPSDGNTLLTSAGFFVRDGLDIKAFFGEDVIIGNPNESHTIIESDHISMVTEEGDTAIDISVGDAAPDVYVSKYLTGNSRYQLIGDSTKNLFFDDLRYAEGSPKTISYSFWYRTRKTQGQQYTEDYSNTLTVTKGVASSGHVTFDTYENATSTEPLQCTITVSYDGDRTFTITATNTDYLNARIVYAGHLRYYTNDSYRPNTVIAGDCEIAGISMFDLLRNPQSMISADGLNPLEVVHSGYPRETGINCEISDGGYLKFGKWVYVRIAVKRTSEGEYYGIDMQSELYLLEGFPSPIERVGLNLAFNNDIVPSSVYPAISKSGLLSLRGPLDDLKAIPKNTYIYISGWYIADI